MKQMKINLLASFIAVFSLSSTHAQLLWTSGHGDIGIGYESGELVPHWHLGEAGEEVVVDGVPQSNDPDGFEYEPGEIMAGIGYGKGAVRPAASSYDFLGVSGGENVWVFPKVLDVDTPFIGFGTEELDPLDWTAPLTITLTGIGGTGVAAGGQFSLFDVDIFGDPVVLMATSDGISGADQLDRVAGTHEHYNLAFTQPGRYDLTFEVAGVHAIDGAKTATATYSFNVIPEPSKYALLGLGLAVVALMSRRFPRGTKPGGCAAHLRYARG